MNKYILGIDTSCDDTSIGIVEIDNKFNIKILTNVKFTQIKEYIKYGGIVPEIAARSHLNNIQSVLNKFIL